MAVSVEAHLHFLEVNGEQREEILEFFDSMSANYDEMGAQE